jgi:hypothetical protein
MRKIATLIALAFISIGCNNQNDLLENSPKKELSENFILKKQSSNEKVDGAGIDITITLGRVSRNCHGFGICELTIGIVIIGEPKPPKLPREIPAEIEQDVNGKYFSKIELNQNVDSNIYDTNFYIEEDLAISYENKTYIIKKGIYELNSNIGKFGGYKLDITTI